MFMRIPLLSASACDSVVSELLQQRPHWTRRGTAEFYTVGAASYLDEGPAYALRSAQLSPLLRRRFAPLYAHLRERLATALAAPVGFAEGKAVPGFHVWGVPGIPTGPCASLHFDLQYQRLSWPNSQACEGAPWLSFTLPLRLPRRGAGLSLWDTTYEQVQAFCARTGFGGSLDDLLLLLHERVEPYSLGELVVHSGHQLHRIAPIPEVEPDDLRITLQGHGVRLDGVWQLYW